MSIFFVYLFNLCFSLAGLSSFLMYYIYVYCYAPTYQVKFLVCENLLGNKTDSDSDLCALCLVAVDDAV